MHSHLHAPTNHPPHTHTTYSCAFVFVLEVEENRILAEQALLLIGNLVKDYIIKDHSVAEVGHSADFTCIHHKSDRSSAMMKQHAMFLHMYFMQADGAIYIHTCYSIHYHSILELALHCMLHAMYCVLLCN